MRAWIASAVLTVSLVAVGPTSARADDEDLSPWRLELDAAYGVSSVDFFTVGAVVSDLCPPDACATMATPTGFDASMARATAGLGFGVVTLEASVAAPIEGTSAAYIPWTLGLRLDTSWTDLIAVFFRFAYVGRWGAIPGEGGRAGIGLLLRLVQEIVLYGEASADVTTVSEEMRAQGALFSYASFLGGGARFSFSP